MLNGCIRYTSQSICQRLHIAYPAWYYSPACETDSPANSINWSRDHPPISMRSLSRAAASFEEIACNLALVPVSSDIILGCIAYLQRHPGCFCVVLDCGNGIAFEERLSEHKSQSLKKVNKLRFNSRAGLISVRLHHPSFFPTVLR